MKHHYDRWTSGKVGEKYERFSQILTRDTVKEVVEMNRMTRRCPDNKSMLLDRAIR